MQTAPNVIAHTMGLGSDSVARSLQRDVMLEEKEIYGFMILRSRSKIYSWNCLRRISERGFSVHQCNYRSAKWKLQLG